MTISNTNLTEELREFWGANPESRIIIVGIGRLSEGMNPLDS